MKEIINFSSNTFSSGKVDFDKKIIYDVVLAEPNREATGHGLYADQEFVNQIVKFGKEAGDAGLKSKFDHPSACFSAMGTQLGRLKNFRLDESGRAIADLHIGEFTASAPTGDLGKWLLKVAAEDPDQIGFSIGFKPAESVIREAGENDDANDIQFKYPHVRIETLYGADVVEQGAVTSSLFQADTMLNDPEIISEKIEKFFSNKPVLLSSLMPLLTKLQDNNNINNNNQNSIKMSDKKETLMSKIGSLVEAAFGKGNGTESTPETKAEEVSKVDADKESVNVELAAKDAELEALKAEIKAKDVEFKASTEASNEILLEIQAEVKALGSETIGDTIESKSDTDTTVELSENEKADEVKRTSAENMAFWASEQSENRTATITFTNKQ